MYSSTEEELNLEKLTENITATIEKMIIDKREVNFTSMSSSTSSSSSSSCTIELVDMIKTANELHATYLKYNSESSSSSSSNENCLQDTLDYEQIDKENRENLINLLKSYKNLMRINQQREEENRPVQMSIDNDDSLADEISVNDIKSILISTQELNEVDSQESLNNFKSTTMTCEVELANKFDDLPKNLIATSLPNDLFSNADLKVQFEKMFTDIDEKCKFCYFRFFKRCSIEFDCPISALLARFQLDKQLFLNNQLRLFLNKPIKLKNTRPFLEPPQNDKTFLISPPSSPPVGWEQEFEDPPVVNYDLIAALSQLKPDEPCELIKPSEDMPGIIIHPCENISELPDTNFKRKYMPTKRPAYDIN